MVSLLLRATTSHETGMPLRMRHTRCLSVPSARRMLLAATSQPVRWMRKWRSSRVDAFLLASLNTLSTQ